MPLAQWVIETARLPVAFAQVREDPLIDLAIVRMIEAPRARCLMIASGGCTAALLAASGRVSHLHLVDFNPAQLALCRLKLHLLKTASPNERLQMMGHAAMGRQARQSALHQHFESLELPQNALGPIEQVSAGGPDFQGRYEILFAHLREKLQNVSSDLRAVLVSNDPTARARQIAPDTSLGQAIDAAFDQIMSLPNLVHLFSAQATQNSREPFARHFTRRTRQAIAGMTPVDNPYLWQLLVGRFPDGVCYPWFTAAAPDRMPEISQSIGTIDSCLLSATAEYDFIHLSNVLDWLSVDEARQTLALAFAALRRGGFVIVRQLNSTLDLPGLGEGFDWLTEKAGRLHARDRSFFYSSLHLGAKR